MEMKKNIEMRDIKYQVNYATLLATVGNYPAILQESQPIFEEIAKDVRRGLDAGEGTLIHGDFWTGK